MNATKLVSSKSPYIYVVQQGEAENGKRKRDMRGMEKLRLNKLRRINVYCK